MKLINKRPAEVTGVASWIVAFFASQGFNVNNRVALSGIYAVPPFLTAIVSWLRGHGGIRGAFGSLWHGNDKEQTE